MTSPRPLSRARGAKCLHTQVKWLTGCAAYDLETGERQGICLECRQCVDTSEHVCEPDGTGPHEPRDRGFVCRWCPT